MGIFHYILSQYVNELIDLFITELLCYFFLSIKLRFFLSSEFARSRENIKYSIKVHVAQLEHCFNSKFSPFYSLYSLK